MAETQRSKRIYKRTPLAERFWAKVDKRGPDECWPWLASDNGVGYGKILSDGRLKLATHVSWELHNGPVPEGFDVLHTCDNPPCVNPGHLFLGTAVDNIQDMLSKKRNNPPRGDRGKQAKLSEAQACEILARHTAGERQCDLARKFCLNGGTISRIISGKRWSHLARLADRPL